MRSIYTIKCFILTLTLILISSPKVWSAKILLLTYAFGSHYMNFQQISEALISHGHEVHALLNGNCKSIQKLIDLGVTVHGIKPASGCVFEDDKELVQKQLDLLLNFSFQGLLTAMKTNGHYAMEEAETIFGDTELFERFKNIGFDLCILEGIFASPYFYLVPYKLDIPYISFLAVFDPLNAGIPGLPSFTPLINNGQFTDEMTFFERVSNALMTMTMDPILTFYNLAAKDAIVPRFAPEKEFKTLLELKKGSSLWLVMNDIAIDYPRVSLPHVIHIGGLNTKPAKPLPTDLQEIADKAINGLIIVSFGSYFATIPEALRVKLLNEFKQVDHTIIWRFDGPSVLHEAPNVHLRKWIPQNDLLGHPNTKVFITHCGVNGQFEALYHGVPMIGLPVFGDQFYNSMRMAKKGLGISLGFLSYKEGEIVSAINEIMENSTYSKNMMKYSMMFKDRPMTPMETLIYWVEHLHKYGSDHLLSPAIKYPWYIYWCIDIIIFYALVFILVLFIVYYLFKMAFNCVRRFRTKQKVE